MSQHRVTVARPNRRHRVRIGLAIAATMAAVAGLVTPAIANATPSPQATAPKAPAAALSATAAAARARSTGQPVVAGALTTATSQTTANPNGSFTRTESVTPTRLFRADSWVALDPTLHTNSDGSVSPNATTADVTLSGGGSGPFATMLGTGHQISLTLPFSLPTPTLSGATATYADVLPSVDLVVTVDEQGGVADSLVVKTATAAANPALRSLRVGTVMQGLTAAIDSGGDITFSDQAGHTIYSASAPSMWDSAPTPAGITTTTNDAGLQIDTDTGMPVTSSPQVGAEQALRAAVGVSVSSTAITLSPDASLLTGSTTSYPVYIDPSITFHPDAYGGKADWTEVESGHPNQTGWHQSGLEQEGDCAWDGCNGIGVTRAMFQFAVGPLRSADIINAQFNVTEEYAPACTGQGDVTMNLFITNAAIGTGTDWANQPGYLGGPIGSNAAMHGYDSSCPAAGVGFNITTALKADIGKTGGVMDFELRADNEDNKYGWKQLSDTATWSTTYDVKPATPFNPKPSPAIPCTSTPTNAIIGKTDLVLSIDTAKASDGVSKPLNVELQVTNLANGGIVSDHTITTTTGSWATLSIPQGAFGTGNYSWRAQASDGFLLSNWSTACAFRVDTTQPGIPTITPTSPASCTSDACELPVRSAITVTFNPAAGSTPTQYRYQINSGLPITVNATNGSWTGTVTPNRIGPNVLSVQGLSAAGTPSAQAAQFDITTDPPATPDPDGDLTGDGHPDQISVGNTDGTPAGLWLGTGNGTGLLGTPTDIGIRGTGLSTSAGAASDWNGAITAHGQLTGDGMQDLLAVFPATAGVQTAEIYTGTGDGSALDPESGNGGMFAIEGEGCFWDEDANCLGGSTTMTQVTTVGQTPQDGCGTSCGQALPDVFAVVNDNGDYQLWQYQNVGDIGEYFTPIVLDSSVNWATKQISGTWVGGQAALEVRDTTTGEVDLYTTGSSDPNANWFTTATKTTLLSSSTTANAITAVDANTDGNPDLWTTNATGAVTYYPGAPGTDGAPTLGAATTAGSLTPNPTHLTSFGATTWANPTTDATQVDIYTADSSGNLWDNTEAPNGQLGPATLAATGWTHYRSVGIADENHDGYPDLVAIDTSTNNEVVLTGSATGLSQTPIVLTGGWTTSFTPYGLADWNHDGHIDTIATDSTGIMWTYPGDLTGGTGTRVQIGTGWTSDFHPFGIADVMGDGHNDILTCLDGFTRLYLGDLTGGSGPRDIAGTGCQNQSFVGLTDYDGDHHPDLIVRDTTTNNVIVNPGPGAMGTFTSLGTTIATSTPALTPFGSATWTDPATSTPQVDIYAADSSGTLWDYTEAPGGQLSTAPTQVATGWTHYRADSVADENHDGYPDLIAIDTSTTDATANDELVFTQTANGQFNSPIVLGPGWTSDLIPYGITDLTHSGHDGSLALQASTGNVYYYPGDLTGGGGARLTVTTGWGPTWAPYGVGDFTSDGVPDILTCQPDINTLLEYDGTGTGGVDATATMLTTCTNDTYFGLTDYNGDGIPDLIVRDKTTDDLIVAHGAGNRWLVANATTVANGW